MSFADSAHFLVKNSERKYCSQRPRLFVCVCTCVYLCTLLTCASETVSGFCTALYSEVSYVLIQHVYKHFFLLASCWMKSPPVVLCSRIDAFFNALTFLRSSVFGSAAEKRLWFLCQWEHDLFCQGCGKEAFAFLLYQADFLSSAPQVHWFRIAWCFLFTENIT